MSPAGLPGYEPEDLAVTLVSDPTTGRATYKRAKFPSTVPVGEYIRTDLGHISMIDDGGFKITITPLIAERGGQEPAGHALLVFGRASSTVSQPSRGFRLESFIGGIALSVLGIIRFCSDPRRSR